MAVVSDEELKELNEKMLKPLKVAFFLCLMIGTISLGAFYLGMSATYSLLINYLAFLVIAIAIFRLRRMMKGMEGKKTKRGRNLSPKISLYLSAMAIMQVALVVYFNLMSAGD